ncbi:D-aminoacyl-tRNA deacylase [Francisella philomiragia]|uniref:D-aminoacyl-tRNA deacylase n=1 Tax=Francisella philomiragia TaxID=28110 RepID=UPI0019047F30|nr:D-aminoacyl-tRNA deacylase [Francisella philomiragia]MBK2266985.1 D-tyrosyl-tRNA(Tyr) deacylase [Francisella philomiragia]MBK2278516.1 D-tyrosyl-tRNA(Tyr) deacylase [Francisella philomiragia]MBK2286294.1 D-tyrosyl-tRNA(Tyr) deacylase [Francisella philomiragia]MBK2288347.1 D-tyrosyl-tRNA(Tyr) deacylase [Francisella philomiragia]MBK2291107.1 D-tyrosyl-tRNA(Tyr) deacylase [Francisella philomiragia]
MLSIIQRVNCANVVVDGQKVADINKGILALACVENEDTHQNFEKMTDKIIKYRIFEDEAGKMNLSLADIDGEIILVPQFTLAADTKKGNRPSFSSGCPPKIAKEKFKEFVDIFKNKYDKVQTGIFGADMKVSLTNDGPVTFTFKV